ncbi:phosphate acyltransferase [Oscillospiraceae bacterium MB08-C2-2]|nr:phosphate acyltransferase [Oscillospiraceae bacterium MB08-C2-2]
MVYTSFDQIVEKTKGSTSPKRMAVAAAADEHTLEAVLRARREQIALPLLVGDKKKILEILSHMGETIDESDIYDSDTASAAVIAVSLIKQGKADFLMKGFIDTGAFLKAVVNKENGLAKSPLLSLFSVFETKGYHKLLAAVDGGMVPYPTLEQKKLIIDNTVEAFLRLGYTCPKVGVLACVETINPKMPETVEADALAQMNRRGEIENCIVDGPISYDCAVSAEIAKAKGYKGETAGDVDILVAPNIHAGNIMGKMLTCTFGAKMAGVVMGASCPIILTSRGATAEEKYLAIALSAAMSAE